MESCDIVSFAKWTRQFSTTLESLRAFNPRLLHPIKPREFPNEVWRTIKEYAGVYDLPILWKRPLPIFKQAVTNAISYLPPTKSFPKNTTESQRVKFSFWNFIRNNPSQKYSSLCILQQALLPTEQELRIREATFDKEKYAVGRNVLIDWGDRYNRGYGYRGYRFGKIVKCTSKVVTLHYYITSRIPIPNSQHIRYIKSNIILTEMNNVPIILTINMKEFQNKNMKFDFEGEDDYFEEYVI